MGDLAGWRLPSGAPASAARRGPRTARARPAIARLGRAGGFTLVELCIAMTVVGVLAAVALPSYRSQQLRAGRADAVAALTRLQLAQEQHRAAHGLYAGHLGALRGTAATSPQGRYDLTLTLSGAEAYRATASVRPGGPQAGDRECAALTLDVVQGFAQPGPTARCWQR